MAQTSRLSGKRKIKKNDLSNSPLKFVDNTVPLYPRPSKLRKMNADVSELNFSEGVKAKELKVSTKPYWAFLPPEILVKIFSYVVEEEESAIPCLLNISKVCSNWRRSAHVPSIWNSLRFSRASIKNEKVFKSKLPSFEGLASRCFKKVKSLTCLNVPFSTSLIVNTVAKNSEQLCEVALNYSGRITSKNCLKSLFELHGEHIESLILNGMEISSYDISKSVAQLGPRLKELILSSTELPRRLNLNYKSIYNLEVLVINCRTEVKIVSLRDLRKLKVLRLINVLLITKHAMELEFPQLEEIEVSSDNFLPTGAWGNITMVIRMLSESSKLRWISFRGYSVRVEDLVCYLYVDCPLEYLDISGSCVIHLQAFFSLFTSLVEVKIDRCAHVNCIVMNCFESWKSLEHLSLAWTDLDLRGLLVLLELEKLKTINLQFCRNLPRGFKRQWQVPDLRKMVARHLESNNLD